MTANTEPVFTHNPNIGIARISTANTNRDGTGTCDTILTAGADGTRIKRVVITATGTTTAGMVRLYIYNGVSTYLWMEIPVTAITPSATVQAFTYVINLYGETALILTGSYLLKASTHNAESFDVIAEGEDY